MKLLELSEKDKQAYNNFVAARESGSFLQSWEWGGWQEALGRQVSRFWVLDDSQQTIGSIQLVKMPLILGKYFLYAPYGPVFAESIKYQVSSIMEELMSKFTDAIFIRAEPKVVWLPTTHYPLLTKSSNIQPAKTLFIDLSKSEEQLLSEMHPKTRYNIKVAKKHGVEIKDEFNISVGHGLFAKEAVELIAQTAQRQGYKDYGAKYYNQMIDCLALRQRGDLKLHIYKAIYQDRLLASAIMLDFGSTRTFLFGGSAEDYKNIMAPYWLHFQAMMGAKSSGLSLYDFWGVETSRGEIPGFVRFKLGFGGQVKEYSGAYDMVNQPFLYRIYKGFRYIHRLL